MQQCMFVFYVFLRGRFLFRFIKQLKKPMLLFLSLRVLWRGSFLIKNWRICLIPFFLCAESLLENTFRRIHQLRFYISQFLFCLLLPAKSCRRN